MPSPTGTPAHCPTCDGAGWIEQLHASGTMARIVPCPARCAQGALMRYTLAPSETGWYLHGPAQGLRTEAPQPAA
jgi:hypothetical protein